MATALTPLANLTLGAGATGVTFSSISSAYKDLMLVVVGTNASTSGNIYVRFNSDAGSNYSHVYMNGDGVNPATASQSALSVGFIGMALNTSAATTVRTNFMDYSATNKFKSAISRWDNAATQTGASAVIWASTAAINTLYVYAGTGTFAAGSTFALYGVSA